MFAITYVPPAYKTNTHNTARALRMISIPLSVYANYADAELDLMPFYYPKLVFWSIDEEEDYRYTDAVFCFADNVRVKGNATYSVSQISEN